MDQEYGTAEQYEQFQRRQVIFVIGEKESLTKLAMPVSGLHIDWNQLENEATP